MGTIKEIDTHLPAEVQFQLSFPCLVGCRVPFSISPSIKPWFHMMKEPHYGPFIFSYNIQHLSPPIDDFINVSQLTIINTLAPRGTFTSHWTDLNSFCSFHNLVNLIFTSFNLSVTLSWFVSHFHWYSWSHWSLPEWNQPQISLSAFNTLPVVITHPYFSTSSAGSLTAQLPTLSMPLSSAAAISEHCLLFPAWS